jgi:hypothetical protein
MKSLLRSTATNVRTERRPGILVHFFGRSLLEISWQNGSNDIRRVGIFRQGFPLFRTTELPSLLVMVGPTLRLEERSAKQRARLQKPEALVNTRV